MKKKLFVSFLFVIAVVCLAVGLSACGTHNDNLSGNEEHEHMLEYYSAVDATETEEGHIEYWYCSDCGKYFSDSDGENELDAGSIFIAARGESTTYTITFIANGYVVSEVIYSEGDTDIDIPEVPSKYGYDGYWESFDYNTGNITVTAIYTPITCYIIYDNTKDAVNYNQTQYIIEDGVIILSDLYLEGYIFNGWYTEDGIKVTEISYDNYSSGVFLSASWLLEEYTATFVDENGEFVGSRTFTVETKYLSVPEVPEKVGYSGVWAEYYLSIGDVTIWPVYTVNAYTAAFTDENGSVFYYVTYTIETECIYEPSVPYKKGYTGEWESYSLEIGGITVSPVYTIINYTVVFIVDEATVDTIIYTINDETIKEPQIPEKDGFDGEWESYILTYGNSITVNALYTTEGASEGLIYSLYGENEDSERFYCVSGYTGSDMEVFIPSIYRNARVEGIQDEAFYGCDSVTKITIDYGISYIGNNAFIGCTSLVDISIPDSVTQVGWNVFYGCKSLKSIVIPNNVTTINYYMFYNCSSLESVIIPESVTSICSNAFSDCTSLKSIVIPDSVISIGDNVFRGCSSLISITLPFVGDTAYSTSSQGLFGYIFGSSSYEGGIATKQYYASGSSRYITYYIPENLTTVTITGGNISYGAFYNCSSLTSINLTNGISTIGSYAFYNCKNITSITIPESVAAIDSCAFSGCEALEGVYITDLSCWGNISFSDLNSNPLYYAGNLYLNGELITELLDSIVNIGAYSFANWNCVSITIPEGITSIGDYAFYNCLSLEDVIISESVLSVGNRAFYNCVSLANAVFGNNVISVGSYAFYNCLKLENLLLGSGLETIGDYAFYGCSVIKSITIPEKVTSIGNYAFYYNAGLTQLSYNAIAAEDLSLNNCVFYCAGVNSKGITVNIGAGVTKIPACFFCSYSSAIYAPKISKVVFADDSSCVDIGEYAFAYCSKLIDILLPDSLTYIGGYAFYNCISLVNMAMSRELLSIEDSTFRGCTALESVEIPDNLTYISYNAFYGCTSLKEIIIPDNVTTIEYGAFEYCTSLEKVTIGVNVTDIGSGAFYGCALLTSIIIPQNVVNIGNGAFGYCTALTEIVYNAKAAGDLNSNNKVFTSAGQNSEGIAVTIGAEVTKIPAYLFCSDTAASFLPKIISVVFDENCVCESIGAYAFGLCYSLISITIPANIISIGDSAFAQCYNLVEVYNLSSLGINAGSSDNGLVGYYAKIVYTKTAESSLLVTQDGYTFLVDYNNDYSLISYTGTEKEITLPTLVISSIEINYYINQYAFYGNTNIVSVVIPDSVYSVGEHSFQNCTSLISVTIGSGVNVIGYLAFDGCTSLKTITLGSGVTYLDDMAFEGCNNLTNICADENNTVYKTIDGNLYSYDGKTLIMYMRGNTDTSFEIPSGVTNISSRAFAYCNLKSITIPDSLMSIGYGAFISCEALETVYLNDINTLCSISYGDNNSSPMYFANYLYLNGELISGDIVLSEGVTSIPYGTFKNSNITSIIIPDSVMEIGEYAFYNCALLESVSFGNSLKTIGNCAFYKCTALTNIEIPDSVTEIGEYAFYNCALLESVSFGNSLKTIGSYAFYMCTTLTGIEIPDSVMYIYSCAFSYCVSVTSVSFGSGITFVGYSAFYRDFNITDVYITNIENWFNINFENATANPLCGQTNYDGKITDIVNLNLNGSVVTELIIPDGVTDIDNYAFYNYAKLESVTVPYSVETIGNYAFYECYNLVVVNNLSSIDITAGSTNNGYIGYYAKNINTGESITQDGFIFDCDSEGNYYLVSYSGADSELTLPTLIINGEEKEYAINQYAFYYNKNITSVVIPDCVISIGERAFYECTALKSVTINKSSKLKTIDRYAFYDCISLTNIVIPESVTSIGGSAFYGCYKLVEVSNLSSLEITAGMVDSNYSYVGYYAKNVCMTNGKSNLIYQDNYLFVSDDGGNYYLVSYLGTDTELVLPTLVVDGSVVNYTINQYAFYGNESITSVTIPENCIAIETCAFYGCSSITSVTIGDDVNSIGRNAFAYCYALTEINFNAVALADLESYNYVFAFAGQNSNGITVTIGADVTKIPSYLFYPAYPADSYPTNIIGIVFAENSVCKSIGEYAFNGCTGLKSIDIPDSVTTIGMYAFNECAGLKSINIPDSVTTIGMYAFSCCTSLEIVTIGNGVSIIDSNTFGYCTALVDITFGSGINSIENDAFYGCSNLKNFIVNENNAYYKAIDGSLYSIDGTNLIRYAQGETKGSFEIPDCVTTISLYAFQGCTSLVSVTISSEVTSIGSYAFAGCSSLSEIKYNAVSAVYSERWQYAWPFKDAGENGGGITLIIGSEVKIIPSYMFYSADNIIKVIFEDGSVCESIGNNAFGDCNSLIGVYISDMSVWYGISFNGVTANPLYLANNLYLYNAETDGYQPVTELVISDDVGNYAFSGCSTLTSVTFGENVKAIGNSAFDSCDSLTTIIIPNNIISIGINAFSGCSSLISVIICDGVEVIGNYMFKDCSSLKAIDIPGSVKTIGDSAFSGCSSLTSVTICDGVETIGNSAFSGCGSITVINIPDSVTSLGGYAFTGCDLLASVIIGSGVESIGEYVFFGCTGLVNITIPQGVKSIGYRAFYDCSSIERIIIPDSIVVIGYDAFGKCSSLREIYYSGTLKEWNEISLNYNVDFSDNGYLLAAAHYYYSEIKPDYTDGYNYWHYDENGEIAVWETTIDVTLQLSSDGKYYIVTGVATEDDVISIISEYNGIPVTQIADNAFYENTAITTIYIPDSITYIGYYAFYGCSSLVSITIPESVECIRFYTFYGCTSLTSIEFTITDGWYVTITEGATSGTIVDVADTSANVTYLKTIYCNYYWYRSES